MKHIALLQRHEDMLLALILVTLLRVESANPHARLPVGLDEFENVLIFFRLKEGVYILCVFLFHSLLFGWIIINSENNNLRS